MTERDLRRTYYPNYFSIDNILACQTLIPCRTEMRLPKFGFLVPDCQSEDLPVGVNLQLPLWAARVLCKPGRKYVSVNIPAGFKEAHRQVTEGNASRVDLSKIHSQYFEAGHLCTSLFHNDAGELAEMLPEVLQQRILCIGESTIPYPRPSWARKVYSTEPIPLELMDILERKILEDSDQSSKKVLKWLEPVRNVPPRAVSSTTGHSTTTQPSSNYHSAQHLIQKPLQQQQQQHSPLPHSPIPQQQQHPHPQQSLHTSQQQPNPRPIMPQQHAIITSSHHNPYNNPVSAPISNHTPYMPQQYAPMNMSVAHPGLSSVPPSAPPSHSLVNQQSGSNFHQSLPYQPQQQQQQHLHHMPQLQHHPHHHHHHNMMQ